MLSALLVLAAVEATIHVDLSSLERNIQHAELTIPAKPGALTLVYPKWIPGEHGPTGPITDLAGLTLRAGGKTLEKTLEWKRDPFDVYSIETRVPSGADRVEISLDYLAPPNGLSNGRLAMLEWNRLLLHPKGAAIASYRIRPSVTVPDGWQVASALRSPARDRGRTTFGAVTLETLVDSPLLAGKHMRTFSLTKPDDKSGPGALVANLSEPGRSMHALALAADSEAALAVTPARIAALSKLIAEAETLFGGRHYRSYLFLVAASDQLEGFGLERHESSINVVNERTFVDDDAWLRWSTLLPHEYVHSWNGKYRRPSALVKRDWQEPLRTDLLWIYEGLTNYLGNVLTARSGLITREQFGELVAEEAQRIVTHRGRSWRSLEDTAVTAHFLHTARDDGRSWRRQVDYYREGTLLWLDVDTKIRELSGGKRSMDDFCRRFYGGTGSPEVKTYELGDIVAALNETAAFDWTSFFTERVSKAGAPVPLGGIERGGWKLALAEKPSGLTNAMQSVLKIVDHRSSLGFVIDEKESVIIDVVPESPAARAGVPASAKIVAVNGRKYSKQVLADALHARKPIELLVEEREFFRSYVIDAREGPRYPVLLRVEGKPDVLSQIAAPRS